VQKNYFVNPVESLVVPYGQFRQVQYSPSRDSCVAAEFEHTYNGVEIWTVEDILTKEILSLRVCMPNDTHDACFRPGDEQDELMKKLAAPTAKAAK